MYKITLSAILTIFLFLNLNSQHMDFMFPRDELKEKVASNQERYHQFIDNDALSSGIYTLKKGESDGQQPHLLDELYYVLEGDSKFRVGEEEFEVSQGDVIYVPAHMDHKFFDIREDLKLLVFFSNVPRPKYNR